MSWINRERRQNWKDIVIEILRQPLSLVVTRRVVAHNVHTRITKFREKTIENHSILSVDQTQYPFPDSSQLLARPLTIQARGTHAGGHLVFQTHHTDLKEFVDYFRENRDKLAAIQEGDRGFFGKIQES